MAYCAATQHVGNGQVQTGVPSTAYSHLDRVFLTVVNQGNSLVVLLDTVDRHTRPATSVRRMLDSNVVDSLPIPVVNPELLPISGKARRKMQFVHVQPQPQE